MLSDALRVIARIAERYTDVTCMALQFDELNAEGRRKLVELIRGKNGNTPLLEKTGRSGRPFTRGELFAWIKTGVNNHVKSLVNKNRFTAKRTAIDGDNRFAKPEISLDASPEARSALEFHTTHDDYDDRDTLHDMATILAPVEFIVFQQLTAPNEASLQLAMLDAKRGKSPGKINITPAHYAEGVGMPEADFNRLAEIVMAKYKSYRGDETGVVRTQFPPVPRPVLEVFAPAEQVVYRQVIDPNPMAKQLAAAAGEALSDRFLAAGLEIEPNLFSAIAARVKRKISHYMENPEKFGAHHAAVQHLETIFDVQVPRTLEPIVVRRLFTLAARAQFEKVTPDVAKLLETIGAEPPQDNGHGNLTCFGVIFSATDKRCAGCAARKACKAKAENYGLGDVSLAPSLLPARASVRIPVMEETPGSPTPADSQPEAPLSKSVKAPSSEREEAVMSHLEANYKRVECFGQVYYKHATDRADGKVKHIVWVGRKAKLKDTAGIDPNFCIRPVKPREKTLGKLVKAGGSYYIPDTWSVDETIKFIDSHASYLFGL